MKIDKVEICNFRNYHGLHEFILDKKVTVLYGDNGYGKSSFFDAIEWCLTNEIERFKQQDGDLSFSNYDCVNHLEREKENASCHVSVYYEQFRLCRAYNVNANSTTFILYEKESDGKEKIVARGQKKVEPYLTKINQNTDISKQQLLKNSYILSQDQVTNFIFSNPKERFDSLANIMGINKITNFVDNLKIQYNNIVNYYEDLVKEIANKKSMMESRINEPIEYQKIIEEIVNLENELNITYEMVESKYIDNSKLSNIIKEINNKLFLNKQQLNVLNTIPKEYDSLNKFKQKLNTIESDLENIFKISKKIGGSENNSLQQLEILEADLEENENEKKLIKEFKTKKIGIKELEEKISKLPFRNLDIETINKEINRIFEYMPILDYCLLHNKEFTEAKKNINEIPIKIEENKSKSNRLSLQIESVKSEILNLKAWLNNNNANDSLQVLVKSIQNIYNYVQTDNMQGRCPVCSSDLGNELDTKINNNLNYFASQISEKEVKLMQMIESKETKEKELINLENDYKKITSNITYLNTELQEAYTKINRITGTVKYVKDLFNKLESEVAEEKIKTANELAKLQQIRDEKNALMLLKKYYQDLLKTADIKEIGEDIEEELEKKKLWIKRKLRRLNHLKKLKDLDSKRLQEEKIEIISYINQINSNLNTSNTIQPFSYIKKSIEQEISSLENDERILNQIRELIIKKDEKKLSLEKYSKSQGEISQLKAKLEAIESKKNSMENYIKHLNSKVGEHAIDFLNQPNSKIQQYYRYLNPTPIVNGKIKFVADNSDEKKRGLSISIPFERDGEEPDLMNVKYTLSSAQLNTLAISIFLVVNDSQDIGIFDFIAIDDPIQNMDDINQYTMCDILSDINKQLIFSTHDLEFLKLFIKKNEHRKNDIRIYFLDNPNLINGKVRGVTF